MVRFQPLFLALCLGLTTTASLAATDMNGTDTHPKADHSSGEHSQGTTGSQGNSVNDPDSTRDNDSTDTNSSSDVPDGTTGAPITPARPPAPVQAPRAVPPRIRTAAEQTLDWPGIDAGQTRGWHEVLTGSCGGSTAKRPPQGRSARVTASSAGRPPPVHGPGTTPATAP